MVTMNVSDLLALCKPHAIPSVTTPLSVIYREGEFSGCCVFSNDDETLNWEGGRAGLVRLSIAVGGDR